MEDLPVAWPHVALSVSNALRSGSPTSARGLSPNLTHARDAGVAQLSPDRGSLVSSTLAACGMLGSSIALRALLRSFCVWRRTWSS